jgi:hypothetical protein
MKRADVFMLAVTAFILANCISYFVRSGAPYVTGWGTPPWRGELSETVGFPFEMYGISFGRIRLVWVNLLGNIGIAVVASYLFSLRFGHRLPPLWSQHSRSIRFSLRAVLGGMTITCLLLGVAMTSASVGLVVRNVVCLAGPVLGWGWLFYRQRASWASLTAVAFGVTLMTLAVDVRYQDASIEGRGILTVLLSWTPMCDGDWPDGFGTVCIVHPVMRASVPVFGLLSFLVIVSVTYSVIRQYYPVLAGRNAGLPSTTEDGAELGDEEDTHNPHSRSSAR